MEHKLEKIDLNDFIQSGEGANGASYDCISDPSLMAKMYNTSYPLEPVFEEYDVAKKVYEMGVPSPEPGKLVTDGERTGILFRRIIGKRSYSRMLADEPERAEELTREFARICKKLHETECPAGTFPDAREQFLHLLEYDKCLDEAARMRFAEFIRNIPEANTALHGDMHIGNAISTLPKGAALSEPHDIYFIDLGYFCSGYPLLDLGMMRNICLSADEAFRVENFHIDGKLTAKVWRWFVDEYFFGPENLAEKYFGPGQTYESIDKALLPYQCCKLLLVEFNLGFMPDNYVPVMRDTFKEGPRQ